MSLVLLALLSCGPDGPSVLETPSWEGAAERPAPRTPSAIALARHPELVATLELPESSRPGGQAAPEWFHPYAPFEKYGTTKKGNIQYRTPLPIHSNLLATRLKSTHSFGSGAPSTLKVKGPEGAMGWDRYGKKPWKYGFNRDYLLIGLDPEATVPEPVDVIIRFPKATDRENSFNFATADQTREDFALRELTIDTTSHAGVYLPAPGTIAWDLDLPDGAVLTWSATVLTPAIRSATSSDGAEVVVEVIAEGKTTEVGRQSVATERWDDHRFDLSAWGGSSVRLQLRTEPGATADYDYVFLEGPAVFQPSDTPRRVVLVFIDTVRPDHLSLYGYGRRTMPKLEKWSRHGAIFEEARSVAPWTLPSARAVLTGAQPELWYESESLSERLGLAGYHAEAVVSNAFLSQPFEMQRGWDRYAYHHIAKAPEVAALGLQAIERHPDRDLLLLVHFMDPHLPYMEPITYRHMWAGMRPKSLESVSRRWLTRISERSQDFEKIRKYVVGRYDQNLRWVDDELLPVLQAAGPGATVVVFSDHGEELWEHGGFEHGHSFYDELLRVPLLVRGPGVPTGHFDAPVSLLDVAPTVLELEGLPFETRHGTSLVGALYGDPGAADALEARPQAFGRPLYDADGWGVLTRNRKFVDRGGRRRVHDLVADPGEHANLAERADFAALAAEMSTALGREVVLGWRLTIRSAESLRAIDLELSHPLGIDDAWPAYDPRGRSKKSRVNVTDGVLTVHQPKGETLPEEVFAIPVGDPMDVVGLRARFTGFQLDVSGEVRPGRAPKDVPAHSRPFLFVGASLPRVSVDFAWVPRPAGVEVSGFSEDVAEELRELGYVE